MNPDSLYITLKNKKEKHFTICAGQQPFGAVASSQRAASAAGVVGTSVQAFEGVRLSCRVPAPEVFEGQEGDVTPRRSPSSPGGRAALPQSEAGTPVPDTWAATMPNAHGKVRLAQAGPGSVLGALDFTLRRPRSSQCLAVTDGSALVLSREKFARMASADPHAYSLLQQIMLRSSLLTTATTQQAMERAVQCAFPG